MSYPPHGCAESVLQNLDAMLKSLYLQRRVSLSIVLFIILYLVVYVILDAWFEIASPKVAKPLLNQGTAFDEMKLVLSESAR